MDGLLILDKPSGMTSHDVVGRLRKITGERSIGHLGTLDPMATGVLPLLMGRFTRLAQYFSSAEKSYTGTIRFGFATTTYDFEGDPVGEDCGADLKLDLENLRRLAARFHGVMQQMPPAFSAKKINGTPAYKLARAGKPVELKPAQIEILEFELTTLEGFEASFFMRISAGGYVRSVAHELGAELGCGAHLSSLRRTQAGVFSLQDSIKLDDLQELSGNIAELEKRCLHPRTLLPEMPAVTADVAALSRLRNGAQANLAEFSRAPLVKVFADQQELACIAKRVAGTLFQPVAVLK